MGTDHPALTFDEFYYAHNCGRPYGRDPEWLDFFGGIADRIVKDIRPRRVLDAGCAIGLLVEALRARGVEADGIDVSEYALSQTADAVRPYCRLGSLVSSFETRYDLVVCMEVLEHMPSADAVAAIANICLHTDDVLFSSSPHDYGEATHVNVRAPEDWAEAFARHGFVRDLDFDAAFVTPWAVRFRRREEPLHRLVKEYERAFARVSLERSELRAQVLQWDRQVQVEAAEAPRLRAALALANEQLLSSQHALAQAHDRINHMERSRFWKLRAWWVTWRALLGMDNADPPR